MPQDPFYASARWRAVRAAKLRLNPTCEVPGCGRRASYVDHIRSIRSGGAPYDFTNLMSLDHGCHSRKTVRSDGRFGRAPAALRGCDVHGVPLDPGHAWRKPSVSPERKPSAS